MRICPWFSSFYNVYGIYLHCMHGYTFRWIFNSWQHSTPVMSQRPTRRENHSLTPFPNSSGRLPIISMFNVSTQSLSILLFKFVSFYSACYHLMLCYVVYLLMVWQPMLWWTVSFMRTSAFSLLLTSTLKLLGTKLHMGWCGWWPELSFLFHSSLPSLFLQH